MEIAIDTSALLAVCTNEPSKKRLVAMTAGSSLVAPHSVHWEMGNAFSAMVKRERITLAQAKACVAAYGQIPIKFVDPDLAQTLTVAARFRMYAYDAYLLVCAAQQNAPLLTLDQPLKIAATTLGITVLEV